MPNSRYLFIRVSAAAFLTLFFVSFAFAQVPNFTNNTSTPVPGGHDYLKMLNETVNPANGSLSLRIGMPVPAGRGLTLPFSMAYNSSGQRIVHNNPLYQGQAIWTAYPSTYSYAAGDWTYGVPIMSYFHHQTTCKVGSQNQTVDYWDDFLFQDPSGGRHALGLSVVGYVPPGCAWGDGSNPPVVQNSGGDDLYVGYISGTHQPVFVASADGTVYHFQTTASGNVKYPYVTPPDYVEDRNGNKIANSATSFTDTLGRTAASWSGGSITVSGLAAYSLTWGSVATTTGISATWAGGGSDPNCSFSGASSGTTTVLTNLQLPNGKQYQFDYDSLDTGSTSYGLVSKITYPTGGYIRYVWGANSLADLANFTDHKGVVGACYYQYDTPAVLHRYVSFDGSTEVLQQDFSYSTHWSGPYVWDTKTTTVTTTDLVRGGSSQTVSTYIDTPGIGEPGSPNDVDFFAAEVPVEQTVVYKNGSGTVLQTVTKTWLDETLLKKEQLTLDTGSTSETDYTYGTGGVVTDKKEFDYGQNPSGTPTRETVIVYHSFGNTLAYPSGPSIFDHPDSVTIYGNGTQVAGSTYAYSPTVSAASVTVGRDSAYNGNSTVPRGNPTSKTQWLSGSSPLTTYTFDDTGQVTSMTDPCGNTTCSDMSGSSHTTTYSYADSFSSGTPPGPTNAYLTTLTLPNTGVAHVETFKYAYSDGQLSDSYDQNSQHTSYVYTDNLRRLTQLNYPDGGLTTNSYSDSSPSPSVTTSRLLTGSTYATSEVLMDGLGHAVQSQLQSDPAGTDYTDTTFDGLGRVWKQSNPHRSGSLPSDGTTINTYDAIGRVTNIQRPDGNNVATSYSGNCVTVTDEQSKLRQSCSDALGRVTQVTEDPSGLGYLTYYHYNALDDLTCVIQGGNNDPNCNPSSGQKRTFAYDSLSRLTQAVNPESGAVNYGYDANGNVATRLDARNITTTYAYDALNRLTLKTYSDGTTPPAQFFYDQAPTSWPAWTGVSFSNAKGRLVLTCTNSTLGTCTSPQSATAHSYDVMGRTTYLWQCGPSKCASNSAFPTSYTYDLAGDIVTSTRPIYSSPPIQTSSVVTYTYGPASDRHYEFLCGLAASRDGGTRHHLYAVGGAGIADRRLCGDRMHAAAGNLHLQ